MNAAEKSAAFTKYIFYFDFNTRIGQLHFTDYIKSRFKNTIQASAYINIPSVCYPGQK